METDDTVRTLKLRLYALEDINDEVLFALGRGRGHELLEGAQLKGQNLKLPRGVVVRVEFKLKDETDRDLEFDCPNALWVQPGVVCPQKPCSHSAVKLVDCSSHKVTLQYDGTAGPFAFALRLMDEDRDEYLFDPIIINDEV